MTAPSPAIDLSVVVVSFNSAALVDRLIPTLIADSFHVEGRPGSLEIIVIDNASPDDDQALFDSLARWPMVRLLRNAHNVGYSLANLQGLHLARGKWHLVSNPDVLVQPGCLNALFRALEQTRAAIVGPLATMDPEGLVLMPPNDLPDPSTESLVQLGRRHDGIARYQLHERSRRAHAAWTASSPLPMDMLSGGFFLAARATLERYGFLDPTYPLYYEDTDLFRRYRAQGQTLFHVPDARIVHLFSRSTFSRFRGAMYRNRIGRDRYFSTHFGAAGLRTLETVLARAVARDCDGQAPFPLEILPPNSNPPTVDLPDVPGAFLEIAGQARFSLAVGLFPPAPGSFTWPRTWWESLPSVHYWCRAVDPSTGRTLKAWRVTKCPPT